MTRERDLMDLDALRATIRDVSADGPTFLDRMQRVTAEVARALGADTHSGWAMDLARPADARVFFVGRDDANLRDYLEVYRSHDPMQSSILAAEGRVDSLSDYTPGATFGRDAFTGEFLPRTNLRHIVAFTAPMPDDLRLGLAFQREPSRRGDFSQRERDLLQAVVPEMARAAFGALLREKAERLVGGAAPPAPDDDRGALVFDALGDVVHADAGGLALLRDPAIRAALEVLAEDTRALSAAGAGATNVRQLSLPGDRALHTALACFALERARRGVLAQLRLAGRTARERRIEASRLTRREREVARLAVEGCSNREIATRLRISAATVSVYMTRVFRKTGVDGRVALTRWFHGA